MTLSPYKLGSVLLQYPTVALFDGLGPLAEAASGVNRASRAPFRMFLDWLGATAPDAVARHYVETFDLRRRCALYLSYYRYGDTRKRGMAMLAYPAAYRAAGFEPADGELPDYLPMVLGPRTPASSRRSARRFRRCAARTRRWCGGCGSPGRPVKRWDLNRSHHPDTWRRPDERRERVAGLHLGGAAVPSARNLGRAARRRGCRARRARRRARGAARRLPFQRGGCC